jgi:hypothetical protein
MVSVMPPFYPTNPAMTFPQQQEEDLFSQYYTPSYRPTPQTSYSSVQSLEAQTNPLQQGWSDSTGMGAFSQTGFFEEPQSLYPQTSSPWLAPSTVVEPNVSTFQTSPSFAFSHPQPSPNFGLAPSSHPISRHSRGLSFNSVDSYNSTGAPSPEASESNFSRSSSPGTSDLSAYGYLNHQGTWSCAYPGCTSRAVFTRGCDLRKHHKRHTKSFFCRYPGCSQATGGGFSSKKDLARHEAKHNPGVVCEWDGCDRIFSRVDNMVSNLLTISRVYNSNVQL